MAGSGDNALKDRVRERALELGFDTVGFCSCDPPHGHRAFTGWLDRGFQANMRYMSRHADLRTDVRRLLPGAKTVIAVTMNYNQPAKNGPRIARYALGRDYHKVLRSRLRSLTKVLPDATNRICVDSAPVLEREFAQRAGLGWFGKNTMLIDTRRGSWFFIGILLTSAEIEPDAPSEGSCGTCTKCVDACPTSAIVFAEDRWQVDARRCISYLTIEHKGEIEPQLAAKMGDWIFGCDVCQDVCPFNEARPHHPERARPTAVPDFLAKRKWPGLSALATIQQEEWDLLTRGSAVRRAGLQGIRRNARNCLSNAHREE